jgi:hypothetical protein
MDGYGSDDGLMMVIVWAARFTRARTILHGDDEPSR